MIERREFYIDGAWVAPAAPHDLEVIDPSTEEPVGVISLGGQADTDRAVAAAQAAFRAWAETPPAERIAALERLVAAYDSRTEAIAEAISLEMGAPADFSRRSQTPAGSYEIEGTLDALREMVWEYDRAPGERIVKEPVGVCALITPWNWPTSQVALKVAPALGVGCTVVLKPSELAPLSAALFAEAVHEAGFPPGVFNLVNGDGAGVGSQLSAHPGIDMVSFTGSTRAGKAISRAAAETLKRVTLELGGKGANILFADAPEGAAERGAKMCFSNSGQSCNAPTRMLVERPIYEAAVEAARAAAEATQVGPASQSGRHIGPVVSAAQHEKIQGFIEAGIAEGARLVAGGPGRPDGLNRGYFVRPTVFADVHNDMTIAREEIFGPVLSIIPFETEEEAVAIANDTPYGLQDYVQTSDDEKRVRVARRLRAGVIQTNYRSVTRGAPFGGYKQSGNGREAGEYGVEEFLEIKAVTGWPEG